jgi:hypothetical protein
MVAPLVAAAAIAATAQIVSGGIQWLNSSKAQRASEAERQRIEGLLNAIQDPSFDRNDINPQDVALLQQYVPEVAPFIKEAVPRQVLAKSQGAIEGRQAQMAALQNYRRLMEQGYDPQTAIEMARAQRAAGAEAASARQTAAAEASRRGFGGGLSFMQQGAGQQAQDRLAMMQQQALADAAQRRFAATGQAATLGGQIRGEDVALERGNIDIINAYNQRLAQQQQDWANRGADIRNQANLRNISEAQRIDELNKANRYNAQVANRSNRNTIAQQQFQNALSKVTGQQGVSQMAREDAYARAAQQNQALQGMSDFASKAAGAYYSGQQQQADREWEREKLNRMYPQKG